MSNPFLSIVPGKQEELVGREEFYDSFIKEAKEAVVNDEILILKGSPGMGKTFFIEKLEVVFKKDKGNVFNNFVFTANVMDDLNHIIDQKTDKNKIFVVIDRFDLVSLLDSGFVKEILDKILYLNSKGVNFLLACTPETMNKLKKINDAFLASAKVMNVPPMDYAEAKKLVLLRLNQSRKKKSSSLSPFTEEEVKRWWKEADGNPRMLLMICAHFYEERTKQD